MALWKSLYMHYTRLSTESKIFSSGLLCFIGKIVLTWSYKPKESYFHLNLVKFDKKWLALICENLRYSANDRKKKQLMWKLISFTQNY